MTLASGGWRTQRPRCVGDVGPWMELRAALPAALQLARLGRVESWLRVTATLTDEELAEFGDTQRTGWARCGASRSWSERCPPSALLGNPGRSARSSVIFVARGSIARWTLLDP